MAANSGKLTICVGDIHGHADRLYKLWHNLEVTIEDFHKCTVIFLGDYCDRGLQTAQVLDFLISLPRRYPQQKHVFLCGNHDLAFAAFVGALPDAPDGFQFKSTWAEFERSQEKEGWWSGDGEEDVHVQGRRWGGRIKIAFNAVKGVFYQGSIYDAEPTFTSYGVAHGDRAGLLAAMPESHREFLRNLVWVHEQGDDTGDPKTSYRKLIAVHAGLESSKPVEPQLQSLRNRDVTAPRVEPLAGRKNVWNTPPELAEKGVLVVSGHHARLYTDEKLRLIIDESGGLDLPIAAIILPSRVIVRDTDNEEPEALLEMPVPAIAGH
ncbi:unnamed protein product [Sphagnum jensenii]|uniref:Calcineurin-like phosphoesterase domain-containing protein n=1 Tax=Sphagnum jensenii TaxID=128206 RepID=A0ABP1ACA4_9BRYO